MHRFTVAGLGKPIERAGIASAAIELHRRQLASSARCGQLLAQTNTRLRHTDPPPMLDRPGVSTQGSSLPRPGFLSSNSTGSRCSGLIVIEDEQPQSGRQIAVLTVNVDPADQIGQRHPAGCGDILQPSPGMHPQG